VPGTVLIGQHRFTLPFFRCLEGDLMSLKTKLVFNVLVGCGAVLATFGCGSSNGGAGERTAAQSMQLRGSVPSSVRLLDNARVRAIGSDGKHYWSYVDAAGHFTITVKPGVSYRVLVTNAQRVGPDRVTGHLVVAAPGGARKWLGIHGGGTLDLGVLSMTGAAASSIHTMSEGEAAGDGAAHDTKGSDDTETHEDDTDESGSACTDHDGKDDPTTTEDDDDVELKAEHDPGEQAHDDLEAEHEDGKDDPGEHDDDQPCAGGGGAGGGGGTPAPAPAPGSTAPAPGSTAPAPAPAPGSTAAGGGCHVSADCAGALICAASVCSAAVIR
jgi:hypothetical protein